MSRIIPFLHQIDQHEFDQWQLELQRQLPDVQVCALAELTAQQRAEVDVAVVANPKPSELQQLPNLVWVQSVWAGVERMLAELPAAPFDIVRLVDPELAQTMSEAVLAWVMYLHREMPTYRRQQQAQQWHQRPYVSAAERRLLVLGLGELGSHSAERLVANGFQVEGWSRSEKQLPKVRCHHGMESLQDAASQADIIINLLPHTPETERLLDRAFFSALKQGASLINFGRGATVDDEALLAALAQQQLSHAVLDVFKQEPLKTDSPFWQHPHITVLPHISAPTSVASASRIVAQNLRNYFTQGTTPTAVNRSRGY